MNISKIVFSKIKSALWFFEEKQTIETHVLFNANKGLNFLFEEELFYSHI